MSSADPPPLRAAVLAELATHPQGLSLARLGKRLGVRMSVLLRELAWLGDADLGGVAGAGLVEVVGAGGRERVRLTAAGLRAAAAGGRSA
jgi:DNA-binding transcriptional ArsR family regulator